MASITPNTLTRAMGATDNAISKAGDYSLSTQAKIIGFLTAGIGFVVALALKHMDGGAAEEKTRAFVHAIPKIYGALFFSTQENNGYKISDPITLDDGTKMTFEEASGAEGNKKVIITFFTTQGETTIEIEDTSFDDFLKKINKDVHDNESIYQKYINLYDYDHFNEYINMHKSGENTGMYIYKRENEQTRDDDW